MGFKKIILALALAGSMSTLADPIAVVDTNGKPLATVMVSRQPVQVAAIDTSDNGYPASGKPQRAIFEITRFADAGGRTDIPADSHPWHIRLRKPGYQDRMVLPDELRSQSLVMVRETDPADSPPSARAMRGHPPSILATRT